MTPTYHLYVDDSGSRDLDRDLEGQEGSKWFALGGILIAEEDEEAARKAHAAFCERWKISYPLHSYEIRNRTGNFSWLNAMEPKETVRFYEELQAFLLGLPVLGAATVVNRLGYYNRYTKIYGRERWVVCKTAFTILTERAAKFAFQNGRRLKVFYERSDKLNERRIEQYYATLRSEGTPFSPENSAKYKPMSSDDLKKTLWECRKKYKSSPLMQVADLYLFPLCIGGFDTSYAPFKALNENAKIIDNLLDEESRLIMGVKYSCFD